MTSDDRSTLLAVFLTSACGNGSLWLHHCVETHSRFALHLICLGPRAVQETNYLFGSCQHIIIRYQNFRSPRNRCLRSGS